MLEYLPWLRVPCDGTFPGNPSGWAFTNSSTRNVDVTAVDVVDTMAVGLSVRLSVRLFALRLAM